MGGRGPTAAAGVAGRRRQADRGARLHLRAPAVMSRVKAGSREVDWNKQRATQSMHHTPSECVGISALQRVVGLWLYLYVVGLHRLTGAVHCTGVKANDCPWRGSILRSTSAPSTAQRDEAISFWPLYYFVRVSGVGFSLRVLVPLHPVTLRTGTSSGTLLWWSSTSELLLWRVARCSSCSSSACVRSAMWCARVLVSWCCRTIRGIIFFVHRQRKTGSSACCLRAERNVVRAGAGLLALQCLTH